VGQANWLPKQPKRPHLEENTLTEITIGKEQANDTDESKKMLHLEQNSVENDRRSNNPTFAAVSAANVHSFSSSY
jgi:hypothetical protein